MKTNYIKALDGIRFLAVSLVLADHWSGDQMGFPASYLGVCMFFVLSGFLITRILLKAKEKDAELERGHGFSLKQFYIRRTIRIFPLYYAVLAVLILLRVPPVREKIFWLASYMTNNYIAYQSNWLGSVDHLWSLAVEEQFYIFFPFLIMFIPLRRLLGAFGTMVVLAVLLRLVLFVYADTWIAPYVLMPACLDAFGLGAALGYGVYYHFDKVEKWFSKPGLLLSCLAIYALTVIGIKMTGGGHPFMAVVMLRLSESIFSVALIGYLIAAPNALLTRFNELSIPVYIGKISYGIYIFHNFIYNEYHPIIGSPIVKFIHKLGASQSALWSSVWVKIIVLYVITVGVASVSWYIFEKPINALKNRYGY